MYVSFFASGYDCQMALLQYLKRIDKPKVALLSKPVSLSECQLQQEDNYIPVYEKLWETKLLQVELGKKQHH